MKISRKPTIAILLLIFLISTSLLSSITFKIQNVKANPDTVTWYMRSDQHTVNTVSGYILNGTQSSTSKYVSLSSSGKLQTWVAVRVWIVFSDGNKSELTDGTYNVNVTRTSSGYGYQNVTWTCPATSLNASDAIMIKVYLKVGSGSWSEKATFITAQLNMTKISGNWTFQLYTKNNQVYNSITHQWTTACYFYWGSSSYNSLIDGIELSSGIPISKYVKREGDTALQLANFSAYWTCGVNLSTAILYIKPNTTASWDSYVYNFPEGAADGWSNFSIVLPEDWETKHVEWYIWCNSSCGASNQTSIETFYCWRHIPSAGYHSIGFTSGGARTSTYYNGSPNGVEAIFIAYLNSSSGTETWIYEIKAWSFDDYEWHGPYILGDSGHSDPHWNPSISVLPDGRLIVAYGYFDTIKFRISTYSAKTCNNIDTLLSNWGPEHELRGVYSYTGIPELCYPMLVRWNDTLLMFARDGSSYGGRWIFWRWVNQSVVDIYPAEFDNSTWNDDSGNYVLKMTGWNPYLDERYKLYDGRLRVEYAGATVYWAEVGKWTFRKGYCEWNASTGKLKILCNSSTNEDYCKIRPVVDGNTLDYKYVYSEQTWLEWNITGLTWDSTLNLQFDFTASNTKIDVYCIKLELNITGFAPAYTLGEKPSEDSYYMGVHPQGNRLYVTMRKAHDAQSLHLIYTDDKGYTWKLYNGTIIDLPFTDWEETKVLDLNFEVQAICGAYESLGKAVFGIISWNYSKRDDITHVYIAQGNGTFGQNIQFTIYNVTLENGGQLIIPKRCWFGFQYDLYYERLAFWSVHNCTLGKFVCLPNNNTVYRQVYTQQGIWRTTFGRILYSPSAYEQKGVECKLLLGNRILGDQTQYTNDTLIIGAKFTVQTNGTLSAVWIYNDPNDTTTTNIKFYAKLALYNSTFHKIATASETCIISGKGVYSWMYPIAFPNPIEVHEGETYWIVFKVSGPEHVKWGYAYSNQGINTTFHMLGNYSDPFPDQLNQSQMTFYNRTITLVGVESRLVVRGLGVDIYPPTPSHIGASQPALPNQECTFCAYWHDDIQLDTASFYWNASGTIQYNGSLSLSGIHAWSNFTRVLPNQYGITIAWYIICNDTTGNIGNTTVQLLQVGQIHHEVINDTVRSDDSRGFGGGAGFVRLLSIVEDRRGSLTVVRRCFINVFGLFFGNLRFERVEYTVILDGLEFKAGIVKKIPEILCFSDGQFKSLTVIERHYVSLFDEACKILQFRRIEQTFIIDGQIYEATKIAKIEDLLSFGDNQVKSLTIIEKSHVCLAEQIWKNLNLKRSEYVMIIEGQIYHVRKFRSESIIEALNLADSMHGSLTIIKHEYVNPATAISNWLKSLFKPKIQTETMERKRLTMIRHEYTSLAEQIAHVLRSLFRVKVVEKPVQFSGWTEIKKLYRPPLTLSAKNVAVIALVIAIVALTYAVEKKR